MDMNSEAMACGRMDFLKLALAGAAVGVVAAEAKAETVIPTPRSDGSKHGLVGKPMPKWHPGELQVHFIHTGVAESAFWIFPDGTTMLVDCGDHPAINRGKYAVQVLPGGNRYAGEWIARYVRRVNPNDDKVDYMSVTHYHADHSGMIGWGAGTFDWNGKTLWKSGFLLAAQQLKFGVALDRCYPRLDDPIPIKYSTTKPETIAHIRNTYEYLAAVQGTKIERFEVGSESQIRLQRDPAKYPDFKVTNVCGSGLIRTRDGKVRDLFEKHHDATWMDENGASTGFIAGYGAFRIFSAGDYAGEFKRKDGVRVQLEAELAKEIDGVDVAKIGHHGYFSSHPAFVKAASPGVWVNCVWDQLHGTEWTMKYLADRKIYPGDRLIVPTVYPAERVLADAAQPWMPDIAPESFRGCHVVVTVPPGGASYTVACLDASDEKMNVVGAYDFKSHG